MTDPRQTSRDSATSARSKEFAKEFASAWKAEVEGAARHRPPMTLSGPYLEPPKPPKRRLITGHGIGWLVQLLVGLATLYLIWSGKR